MDLLVATTDHCCGVPGLSQTGERHSLEVPPQDLWRPLGLDKLVGLPPVTELRLLARAKHLLFFFTLKICSFEQICNLFTKIQSMIRFQTAPELSRDSGSGWLSP